MKKILLLFAAVLMLTACNDDDAVEHRAIRDFGISSNAWGFRSGNAPHYFYNFSGNEFPEMNDFIYDQGTIVAYYDDGTRQVPLPYVRSYEEVNGGNVRTYTQTIDYDYSRNGISFYVTNSDFIYNTAPMGMNFRVVLLW